MALRAGQSKVYPAPLGAQSHLQSLSARSLFSATFIPYRVLVFPCKQPRLPLHRADSSCLRN